MRPTIRKPALGAAAAALAIAGAAATSAPAQARTAAAPRVRAASTAQAQPAQVVVPMRTADQAVHWFRVRKGSTAYEGYCERAVRLAWNRRTHHASAIAHWRSSDGARHRTGRPPRGAFVFWNISSYGHVGIADGHGGFWSTSIRGRIGHRASVHYFSHYLGWKRGNSK